MWQLSREPSLLAKASTSDSRWAAFFLIELEWHDGLESAGQWEVCLKLAELGAVLSLANAVSETCCNCMSVCCCIIVMLTFFFELVWKDSLGVGC